MEKSIRWVGLDVHADSIAIAELDEDTKEVRTSEVDPSPKAIAKRFKRMAVGVDLRVCYEAGGCGFELYRQLASLVFTTNHFGADGVHFIAQAIQCGHVGILHHEQNIVVLLCSRITG